MVLLARIHQPGMVKQPALEDSCEMVRAEEVEVGDKARCMVVNSDVKVSVPAVTTV